MISIRLQPYDSHIVASLFYIFKKLGKCIISPGKVRSGPKTLVHYNLYLYLLINKKINVDLSELCQEEKKVFLHLQLQPLSAAIFHIYSRTCPVLPCIIYPFLTIPNKQNLNRYHYLFIENINIRGISNQKILIDIFFSIHFNNISFQTCNFFTAFDFQKLNGFVYLKIRLNDGTKGISSSPI